MRQSNTYIIIYATVLSIVCAGLLVAANTGLKERQQANIDLEQKKNILSTVMQLEDGADIEGLYKAKVTELVVDANGKTLEGVTPKEIIIASESKKPAAERRLPVYMFKDAAGKIEYVVLPVFGKGLWDAIWGFVSLESDMNTVKGVKFEHKGETPGLGARIVEEEIQNRYVNKEIFNGDEIASVVMMKGEGNDWSGDKHKVDGMSGATLTAKGVNEMLKEYLAAYEVFLKANKKNVSTAGLQ